MSKFLSFSQFINVMKILPLDFENDKSKLADIEVVADPSSKHGDKCGETSAYVHPPGNELRDVDPYGEIFLRTSWQVQGYLMEQADAIEK